MRASLGAALVALLVVAGSGHAAISVVATGTLTTSAAAPPVRFELGAAGASTRYFSPLALSTNATSVAGTFLARAGADLFAQDALRIVNARGTDQTVTLSAAQIVSAQLDVFHIHVYDGASPVATLDLEAASPGATFTLPASASYRVDARIDLADGAGRDNAPTSFTLSLRVGGGGIILLHGESAPLLDVRGVEAPLGKLAVASSVGANATNGTAAVAAAVVVAANANVFYLNNTNASAAWHVKLVHVASSGLAQLTTGNVGVDNGTLVEHVKISSGTVTQESGSYQRLEPGSTNRIYVRTLEGVLFSTGSIDLDVLLSDTPTGDAYTVMKARVVLT